MSLTGYIVTMVTCYVVKETVTCLMTGHLFDTIIEASTDTNCSIDPWTIASHLNDLVFSIILHEPLNYRSLAPAQSQNNNRGAWSVMDNAKPAFKSSDNFFYPTYVFREIKKQKRREKMIIYRPQVTSKCIFHDRDTEHQMFFFSRTCFWARSFFSPV